MTTDNRSGFAFLGFFYLWLRRARTIRHVAGGICMSITEISRYAGVMFLVVCGCGGVESVLAQQPGQPKSDTAVTDQSTGAANVSESATKAKIIASAEWKQAYNDFQKWLASQIIYTPAEIEQINANLAAQIQAMPASELQDFLRDRQAKLQVLNGKEFQDAQQWLGEYLSVLADGFRLQTLRNIGLTDFSNMTADQLEDAFMRVRAHRLSMLQQRAAFDQNRQQMVQMVQQSNAASRQAQEQRGPRTAAQFGTNQSPYRPPILNPLPPARRPFFVDSNGRIGYFLPF